MLGRRCLLGLFWAGLGAGVVLGQEAKILYQGKLAEAGAPANGTYSMLFVLYDSGESGAGKAIGNPVNLPSVEVQQGAFAATLDFGPLAFDGSRRFLEISVRPVGEGGAMTLLTPRQE
ncbi:MAG: hypothetical protein J0L85_20245, partial [Zoogloea sp.]|nr:hypothetical protein [Zoogloea sp.]